MYKTKAAGQVPWVPERLISSRSCFQHRYTRVSVTSKTVLNCLTGDRVHSLGGDGVRPVTNGSGIASTVVTVGMYW